MSSSLKKQMVCLITLGCPKNVVEGESMAGIIKDAGFDLVPDINNCDCAVIHTCSFIADAKDESVAAIKAVCSLKNKGAIKKIVVTGCLVQSEGKSVLSKYGAVDAVIGTGSLSKIGALLKNTNCGEVGKPGGLLESKSPRLLSSLLPSAYLRLSEGCNHKCSFCSIPRLRGKHKSRTIESICNEAKALSAAGIKELVLIAQDTTSYGKDRYGVFALSKLMNQLSQIKGIEWIRLLYAYPSTVDARLIETIKNNPKICKYIDLPLQHVSKNVLSLMHRPVNAKNVVESVLKEIPDAMLRTTFIVGFPGETEKDFNELLSFVKKGYFEQLGVFQYCDNYDVTAFNYKNKVSEKIKKSRFKKLMLAQQKVLTARHKKMKGKVFKALCEGYTQKGLCYGRTEFQAPEIDGKVFFKGNIKPGAFVNIKVKDFKGYDLIGEVL